MAPSSPRSRCSRPRPPDGRSARRLSPCRTARPPSLKGFGPMPVAGVAPPDRPRDLELPLVERERVVPRLLLRAPPLSAADAPLDVQVARRVEPELDDPVREIRFLRVASLDGLVRGVLRDYEGRRPEVPEPLEEVVQVRPPVLELRHRLHHVHGVDDEEADLLRLHEVRRVHLEQLDPRPPGLEEIEVLADRP